jgi:hypothetical protein
LDIISSVALFIIIGIVLQFLFPPLALPFFVTAAGLMVSMITFKALDHSGHLGGELSMRFKMHAFHHQKHYAIARVVLFIGAVILAPFLVYGSIALAAVVGLVGGAMVTAALAKRHQLIADGKTPQQIKEIQASGNESPILTEEV